ncbi:hypothetical protein JQ615_24815 [Bradyrhizobium jicamae]|uniref:Uncharacterized protein n=1 Tax=Bradyrhizobium jicamae TaxID=280332 RepID=A0ABS5FPA6_9BRAD|nr:hypothetical protein [Bradyrhizobium jicamae]MBR0798613.1 hypothetical protein [Bradyrhizobium jicamae]
MMPAAPRNKLVYPHGARAEINRDHPAYLANLRYVGVPLVNSFYNVLTGVGATVQGGSPVVQISPETGAGVNFATAGSRLITSGIVETPARGVTLAAIVTPFSTSTFIGIVSMRGISVAAIMGSY